LKKNIKKFIVIPVYNDWRSLNKLLIKLDNNLKKKFSQIEILIINDNSTEKLKLSSHKFNCLKKINILTLSKNVGSQRAIAMGLIYLKKVKGDFVVTVMDSDGEDDPIEVPKMMKLAMKNSKYVITSNRKSRKESKIIVFLYRIHLLLTFLFTFKWLSFGNFTSFRKENLSRLFIDNSLFCAYSSAIMKNCSIKRTYAKRRKRYFDKSKLGLISLIEHSLRVNSVFFKNIIFSSIIYVIFFTLFFSKVFNLVFFILILIFNFLIMLMKFKYPKIHISYIKQKIL
jgi:polyisoprenyl-phosphate glycosyltransferase